jgi:hypothetical protein
MPMINDPAFYGSLCEFHEALEAETDRLRDEEFPVGAHLKQAVAKVKLLDLLVLTGKKIEKLQKTYEGDPTPDIFPNEEGGDG